MSRSGEPRRTRPEKTSDDLTIQIGEHRFDPVEQPVKRPRRRAGAREPEVPPPAPADADDQGRARGRRARRAATTGLSAEEMPGGPPDTRIVQFTRALMDQDIERLRSQYGLALTAYVPNFAYVERPPENVRRRLQRDPLVRAIVPYLPQFKLSALIDDPSQPRSDTVSEDERWLDAFLFDRGSLERVVAVLESVGARDIVVMDDQPSGGLPQVRFVIATDTSLDPIAELDDVRWIEPVPVPTFDNVSAASVIQSGDAGTASIWTRGIHGEGQVIAVMDEGPLDINHCFFDDAGTNQFGPGHRKVIDIRNLEISPPGGHATFVAGCAAGDERARPGANARRGGAWAARLVAANALDLSVRTLLAELNDDMASGAFVHTNSWHDVNAGNPARYTQQAAHVDQFTWTNEDHIVFGSSGNSSPGESQGPPGTAKNAVCVSAAQAGANAMTFGDGNPGPTADGRRKPELLAVGCGIQSAQVTSPGSTCGTGPRRPCATSYATPHAAAAAALIRQYLVEGWYPTGEKVPANSMTPTGALLRAILVNATVDMTGVANYPNDTEGWGLLRLDRALFFPGSRRRMMLWDVRHATGPTNRETRTHTVEVTDDTEELKVTMVFSDPAPATGSFASPVVNDMDLRVIAPDGTLYLGNDFANGVSRPNSAAVGDTLNTIETVLVRNPAKGRWTIEVQAFRVSVGNPGQGYGLVATAGTKSGCFVAGAVYGDPDHPEVEALRAWRDRWLERGQGRRRRLMQAAVRVYGRLGPPASRLVAGHAWVRAVLRRWALSPLARHVGRPSDSAPT
jgi:hypothetical protein